MKSTLLPVISLLCFATIATAQLQWTNLTNVAISGIGNNTLTNTGGGYWEDAAFSIHSIPAGADGYLQFTATAGDFVMGLSSEDGPSYYSINYGIMVQGGNIYVAENNNGGSPVSTYTAEDALRIERQGTTIRYLKNGITFYTSSVSSTSALFVDCSLNSIGSTISGIYFSPAESTTTYPVIWSDLKNLEITEGNTLTKTGSVNNWDAGAVSSNLLPSGADGYLEFVYSYNTGYFMLGLSLPNSDPSYTSISYAIYPGSGGLYIYEQGTYVDYFGSLLEGDVLKVAREGIAMNYYKNGILFHSTPMTTSIELQPDVAIYNPGLIAPAAVVSFNTRSLTLKPQYSFPTLANTDGGIAVVPNGGDAPYTYLWSDGGTGPSISGKSRGSYTVRVTDAANRTVTSTYYLGFPVVWTNLEKISLNSDGSLTGLPTANWWGGGSSLNVFPGNSDGYIEFQMDDLNTQQMIGLSDFDANSNYTTIDFAIYFAENKFSTSISGAITSFGSFKKGDVFQVAREGATIVFYRNGTAFSSWPVNVNVPLMADVSVYNELAKTPVISASFEKQMRMKPVFIFPDQGNSNGSIALSVAGTYTPSSIAWTPGNETGYLITDKGRDVYTVTVNDAAARSLSRTYRLGYPVSWTDVQNAKVNADNTLSQIDPIAWTGGAISSNYLDANTDGWMEFVVQRGENNTMMGLSKLNSIVNYASIDYAFYIANSSSLYIYESGVEMGFFGYLQEGDVLSISREGTAVSYYMNGSLLFTSGTSSANMLLVDVSLNNLNIVTTPVITCSFSRPSQVFYSIANGNWNDVTTWSLTEDGPPSATYPAIGDVANIKGYRVTVNTTIPASIINVTVTNDNTLLYVDTAAGELNIKGQINIQGVSNNNAVKALQVQNEGKIKIENP